MPPLGRCAQNLTIEFCFRRRLPDEVKKCKNYAYLQEIYDAVRSTDSKYLYMNFLEKITMKIVKNNN